MVDDLSESSNKTLVKFLRWYFNCFLHDIESLHHIRNTEKLIYVVAGLFPKKYYIRYISSAYRANPRVSATIQQMLHIPRISKWVYVRRDNQWVVICPKKPRKL